MNSNKIREGIGFIDEDLIAGAIEYTRTKKKNGWMKWAAMAACFCLMTCLAIPFIDGFGSSSEPASPDHGDWAPDEKAYGGLQYVQNPVYDVVEYTVPAEYTPAELYIATTTDLDEYDAHMVKYYGDEFLGKGIRVFNFVEGATTEDVENFNVWYFDYDGTSISRIYYVTKSPKSPDKMITAWTDAGECGKAIEALSSQTSAETPMYLVHDDELLFAVIGDSAYYLPHSVFEPQVEVMPEISTEDMDINTIVLLDE